MSQVGLRFLDGVGYAAYSLRLAFSLQYLGARFASALRISDCFAASAWLMRDSRSPSERRMSDFFSPSL